MSILNEIGVKHGTDKSSLTHDYLRKYEKYLPYNREDNLKILEIGVLDGGSVRTWKEYFYNSEIIGIDINPECKVHEEDRIKIEIGSQTDANFLTQVCEKYGPFDIILDDGSHLNSHVIFSFQNIFNYVKSQGHYIVEDACTSYWSEYGGGNKLQGTMVEHFKDRVDEVNFFGEWIDFGPNFHARKDSTLVEQFKKKGYNFIGSEFESINFLNSIILITKR